MMTAEARAEQEKKIEEQRKRRAEKRARVQTALQNLLKTVEGQIVFRHMAEICDQFSYGQVINQTTGELIASSSMHNMSRRTVYIDFRRMMTEENKRIIESKGEGDE